MWLPVVIFAIAGIVERQMSMQVPQGVLLLTWLTLSVALVHFVMRLVVLTYRHCKENAPQVNQS